MDGKIILDAAERDADDVENGCQPRMFTATAVLAVRDHVAAETRKQVIAKLRAWANNAECDSMDDYKNDGYSMAIIDLERKLDSMEGK